MDDREARAVIESGRRRLLWALSAGVLGALVCVLACVRPEPAPPETAETDSAETDSSARQHRAGAVLLAGVRFPVSLPVVTFADPGGYDAYSPGQRPGLHYLPGRRPSRAGEPAEVRKEPVFGQSPQAVAQLVDLVVVHYDACGTSRQCFRVLHDVRGLSCHFLVDVDGTVYQTLDLADTAWHAGPVNARSIGIEIAHVGAEPPAQTAVSDAWYHAGPGGVRLVAPGELEPTGWPADFSARPARPERIWGRVQGQTLVQYDFTPEQYDALARLLEDLVRIFPRVAPDVPRDASGGVRDAVLAEHEIARFRGIAGHWHVGGHKVDPGPAFDWERVLPQGRARRDP